jgi:hypothetical protein
MKLLNKNEQETVNIDLRDHNNRIKNLVETYVLA